MRADHSIIRYGETLLQHQPFRTLKQAIGAYVAYPFAERLEGRDIRSKISELRSHYALPFGQRREIAIRRLTGILQFAGNCVPYYRDLFRKTNFDPMSVLRDVRYLDDLPFLTKDVIREQGDRLHSRPLRDSRYHACKTGGSTGSSCTIFYDQEAVDYSSAVSNYARQRIGKHKLRSELHFACRFPEDELPKWPSREDLKCFAMNRSNIFFNRIDDQGLEEIWRTLLRRKPFLVQAHPSTIYALAQYVDRKYGGGSTFDVFESSGELLAPHQREIIKRALRCQVINRYGLAELGVVAYELDESDVGLQVLESECWPESRQADGQDSGVSELVFTGFRNRLMPMIRYATGDLARIERRESGIFLADVVGRIHDVVPINGISHPTHHIQDVLDHRVGGIQEFQIDLRTSPPTLRIVLEPWADEGTTTRKLTQYWRGAFTISYCGHDELQRVGRRAKFRRVVAP
ncbi:phenylacetate--CoA ligase family protein [Pandoraea sp. SD6-2]|uniref:phenylacetate--CoA ligase family protein n=1 Tax=Pandoraea sp. SD6-2 TaxID=1286093 RepID=UPI00032E768E|nr:phenylacetate--CoA ligase family protein [Pandoraea sp. SD6-2]EON11201.1 hypothetical protein C266_22856 [Pandoraea sp. SD6-2]